MAGPYFFDRVRMFTATSGTGTLTLHGPPQGFRSFSLVGDTNIAHYEIEAINVLTGVATGDWEVGLGTYVSSGNQLQRTKVLASSNGGAAVSFGQGDKNVFLTVPAIFRSYIVVREELSSGNAGGTFTSGDWRVRNLNIIKHDDNGLASLTSNQVTFAAGTYRCRITCPACHVGYHQARLYNATAGATVLTGTSEFTSDFSSSPFHYHDNVSVISGVFTVAASQALEVHHRCGTTQASFGLGNSSGYETEIYTNAEFWVIR